MKLKKNPNSVVKSMMRFPTRKQLKLEEKANTPKSS